MKTPTTIAVVVLHVAVFALILIQPSCKSSEESINPDLTSPEQTQEVPVAVEGTLPPEGSDNLRVAPTRPVYALSDRGANEIPTDTFVQPEEELIPPSEAMVEPEVIEPKAAEKSVKVGPEKTARHTVKRGDNLTKIAKQYNTTVNAIMEANGIARNQVLHVGKVIVIPVAASDVQNSMAAGPAPISAQSSVYVVQKGDSLSKIAAKYNTSVGKIMSLNGMNKTSIRIGQKLKIPSASSASLPSESAAKASGNALTHKVGNGETLGGIAIKYKVPLKSLMEANGIKDPRKLRVGQVIVIKKESGAPKATESKSQPVERKVQPSESKSTSIPQAAIDQEKPAAPSAPAAEEQKPQLPSNTAVPSEAVTPAVEVIEESVDL